MADHLAPSVVGDAFERAWRTLWQGFIVDGLAAAGTGLVLLLSDADLSSPVFWNLAALMVAKSLAVSFASFLARLKSTPIHGPVG
jgi:ribose/xylose/arabinose/galactoside ABC-type transport system permease subunit